MKKILISIFLVFFLFGFPGAGEEVHKVEVTAKVANIRSGPALSNPVIGKGFQGDVFTVLGTEGSWIKIEFPAVESKVGYVYKTIVKFLEAKTVEKEPEEKAEKEAEKEKKAEEAEIKKEKEMEKTEKEKLKAEKKAEKERKKAAKKAEKEKKKALKKAEKERKKAEKEKMKSMSKEEREKLKAEKKAQKEKERALKKEERAKKRAERKAERERMKAEKEKEAPKVVKKTKGTVDYLFKGFYLKGGWMTKPKVDSFGDKWVLDLGFDTPIGKYLTWGLEFQPYFRSYSADFIDFTAYNLVSNIFINVKGGISPGLLWDKLDFITVYLGGGPGASLSFLYSDYEGVTGSQFDVFFAWHIVYGAEFKLGKLNVVVEFQSNKVINPDFDPSTESSSYFLLGIRF